jgi:hypothetical protein
MKKVRILGIVCGILSQIFGVSYLFYGIAIHGFTPDEASSAVTVLIQLALVVTLIFAFYLEKRKLVFGTAMISMCFSGISYLANDGYVFASLTSETPVDSIVADLLYLVVDLTWVVNLVLVFLMAFGEKVKHFRWVCAILFFACALLLWVALVFYGLGQDYLSLISCIGDSFALLGYALAILYVFHSSENVLADSFPSNPV